MPALLLRFVPHLGLAALVALAGVTVALKVQTTRLHKAQTSLAAEASAHAADIAHFKAAQHRADADWRAQVERMTADFRRQKDDADRQADATLAVYRDRVLRLPAASDTARATTPAGLPGAGTAEGAYRSGDASILLARADALICAKNSARLMAAHEWAIATAAGLSSSVSPEGDR